MVKRRANKRAKRRKSSPSKVVTMAGGFPDRMRMKLKYTDLSGSLTTVAGLGYTNFRLAMTDLVDPDITGVGAQSPLFDNMRLIYNRWRVNSCKVTAMLENYTNFPTYVTLVGLFSPSTNSPTSPSNPDTYDLMALPPHQRSDRKRLSTVQVGDKNSVTVSKVFYPAQVIGENYYSSVNFAGGTATPTQIAVVDIIAQTGAPSSSVPNIGCWLSYVIEYDVTFYNLDAVENAVYD